MKRTWSVLLAALIVFAVAGQAAAYFERGHLIRVVYDKTGSGFEVATDLFDLAGKKTAADFPVNQTVGGGAAAFNLSMFPGKTWADLNVEYWAMDSFELKDAWLSGPSAGQTATRAMTSLNGNVTNVSNYYKILPASAGTVVGENSYLNSHWKLMDKAGIGIGTFGQFLIAGWGHANLADLATVGYVDQVLYFYDTDKTNNVGLNVAVLRTMADGSTIINPATGPVVPVPAAVWLLGTGLIGLVGIRRRQNR